MEIFEIINNIIIAIALGFALFSIKDLWKTSKEAKRLSVITRSMLKHRWLVKMGMVEQAKHFNAFGLRFNNHNPFVWY